MQTPSRPSPLAVGRVSGRLFLSPSPSPFLRVSRRRRHRGYNVAIPNTSGRRQPQQQRERAMRRRAAAVIVSFKKWETSGRASGFGGVISVEGDSFFAPPPLSLSSIPSFLPSLHAFLGRSTRTPLGLTIRGGEGEDGTSATHSLTHSVGRSPERAAPACCTHDAHAVHHISITTAANNDSLRRRRTVS